MFDAVFLITMVIVLFSLNVATAVVSYLLLMEASQCRIESNRTKLMDDEE